MRKKNVTLGLQGGGSHGAFTWGVLDRLLEDERIGIDGISGASAGAMNAVLLAHGFTCGGRDGARQALKDFWESVATGNVFDAADEIAPTPAGNGVAGNNDAAMKAFLFMARFISPSQFNPYNINPLRDILLRQVDFERLRTDCKIALFIAATKVSTGTLRIFRNHEMRIETLLASACLPALHHSITIEDEAYWDGGLTANPPILPLIHECTANDLILILLHPTPNPKIPSSAGEITQRLTEISFSSPFSTELRGLALEKREAERGLFSLGRLDRRLRKLSLHRIDSQDFMSTLSTLSKANTDAAFIAALRNEGRARADLWLRENFQHLGVRSSCKIDELLH
jgi:NTE family protein